MKPRHEYPVAAVLIGFFIAVSAAGVANKSATVDESAHLAAGAYAWETNDFSLYGKSPPLGRMLLTLPALPLGPEVETDIGADRSDGWLPWRYGALFMHSNWEDYGSILFVSRLASIIAGASICLLTWLWSRSRYGSRGGLVSLFAVALSPTLIAHSRLVTTDSVATLFTLLFFMALLYYLARPGAVRAALMAAALGLATLCKFTSPFFAPFALAAPLLARWRRSGEKAPSWPKTAAHMALITFVCWLVVVGGYLGRDVSFNRETPIGSGALKPLKPLVRLVPLPTDFLVGLDWQLADAERGEFVETNYLLGRRYSGAKPHYYAVAVLAKTPVPLLVGLALTVWLALVRGPRRFDEVLLLLMVAAYFVFASLFSSLQIGVRYLLVLYPACFMLMGKVGEFAFSTGPEDLGNEGGGPRPEFAKKLGLRRALRAAIWVGGTWLIVDHAMVWPDYLAYFNPLAGGPGNGYKVLADSNLDWGQDLPGLKKWMDRNKVESIELAYFGHDDPKRHGIDYALPGREPGGQYIAISANFLTGAKYPLSYNPAEVTKEDPLWEIVAGYVDRDPVAMIGYSIFVFDATHNQRAGQ